jgi:hypothetical protein
MKKPSFKWSHDGLRSWYVSRLVRRIWGLEFWEPVCSFLEDDMVKGRQRCEAIIEQRARATMVTFFYDDTGRQTLEWVTE